VGRAPFRSAEVRQALRQEFLSMNKEAKEAAECYASVFTGSKIKSTTTLHNTPSGTVDIVKVELLGQEFTLISAGPLFEVQ
jgi:predicted 3-demethylubiquinone-9 3-methyltransferase (glyoxalase superfamily)